MSLIGMEEVREVRAYTNPTATSKYNTSEDIELNL